MGTVSHTNLVPQEDAVHTLHRLVPDDQQAPAVANEDPGGVAQMSLQGFHGAQRLPAPVVIWQAAEEAQVSQQESCPGSGCGKPACLSPPQNLFGAKGLTLNQHQGGNIQEEDAATFSAQGCHVASSHKQDHRDVGKGGRATMRDRGRWGRVWAPPARSAEDANELLLLEHCGPSALTRT